jgi:TolB-like protein
VELKTKKFSDYLSLFILLTAFVVGGCQAQMVGTGAGLLYIFDRPDVNLREKDYAAADYLMQAGGNFINRNDTIKALPLQNIAEPQLSTRVGRVMSQDIGERIQQLGYNVDLTDVSKQIENDFPYSAPAPNGRPMYLLTGTYHNAKSKLEVNLRLIDTSNSRAVAQFDYNMPMSYELERMVRPKPRIIRTTPANEQSVPVNR